MKKLGILGGMSPESTIVYYQEITRGLAKQLGPYQTGHLIINSVHFADIIRCFEQGLWEEASEILVAEAKTLERAGVDGILLSCNTLHKASEPMENQLTVPFLHIIDCMAFYLQKNNIHTVGLLGSSYTMSDTFYKERMKRHGIEVIVPSGEEQQIIHETIVNELVQNKIQNSSRERYLRIMEGLIQKGAQGIILGCTEIGLLISEQYTSIPIFDSTSVHIEAARQWMMEDKSM